MKNSVPKSLVALAALVAIGAGAGVSALASAQTASTADTAQTAKEWRSGLGHGFKGRMGHGAMGTVTAVNGNTVTITNQDGTTYTIDATNAKITKVVDLTVSDIKVGDTIGAMGTVSGNSVTATHIMDGMPPKPQAPPTTTQ